MERLGHMPLTERVCHELRQRIITGGLAPSERLDEKSLALELGVSRTPLREAISRLITEGLVQYRPYQGNFVRSFTTKEVEDLYTVRRSLEETAIRLATARLTAERIDTLRGILDRINRALLDGDLDEYGESDRLFHETIARYSDNVTLIECLKRLDLQVRIIRTLANRNPEVVAQTALQRPQVLAALEARDPERAAALMAEHIESVRRAVVADVAAECPTPVGARG